MKDTHRMVRVFLHPFQYTYFMEGPNKSTVQNEYNSVDEKLYAPRTVEGEVNEKFFEVLRFVEEQLSGYPWFIAVAPYGSMTKGYSDNESDIDYHIFTDGTFTTADSDVIFSLNDHIRDKFDCKVHNHIQDLGEGFVKKMFADIGHMNAASSILKDASRLAIGPRINELRQSIREALRAERENHRLKILVLAMLAINREENASADKMTERLTHDESETKKIIAERMELWKRRLETLWGYPFEA
jgi:hypothetical protein